MSQRSTQTAGVAALLGLLGCAPAEAPSGERTPRTAAAEHAEHVEREAAPPSTPDRRGQRGRIRGGERIERSVTWPEDAPEDLGLDAEVLRAAAESTVPVLAPRGPWTESLTVIPLGDAGFSLRARHLRSKLVLQGSRIARLHEGLGASPGDRRIRGVDGRLGVNEGIRSASWIEGGVAYTADLECGDRRAPECASDEGFLALLDTLTHIGGQGPIGGAP